MKIEIEKGLALRELWSPIRQEVFINEQGFEEEFDEIDEIAYHVVLIDEELPVATGRLFPHAEEGSFVLGRIAVLKSYRGKELGALVVSALCEKAKELGGKTAVLSAQTRARGFYEKLFFTAVGEEYMDEHCPHIQMKKPL